MTITTLPPAPSRTDPSTFSAKSDALLGALATFVTEANALESNVNAKESSAASSASTATTKASEASSSASVATAKATEATAARNEAVSLVLRYQGALTSDPSVNKTGGALVAGDWYVNSSTGYIRAYNGSGWFQGISTIAGVSSVNGNTGAVTVDKTSVGLGNVDNTSDVNKPISDATATALSGKQDTLVSGTSIKTVNGASILGSGDLQVSQKQVYSMGVSSIFGSSYNSFDDFGQYLLAAYHSSGTAYVRVCKVNSDGTITTGTPQTFSMYNSVNRSILVFMLSNTAGCIVYPNTSNFPEIRKITIDTTALTVSIGTVSSLGTAATFDSSYSTNGVKLTSQKLLVCYQQNASTTRGYLGINLNTDGSLSSYYHQATAQAVVHETLYSVSSTRALVFAASSANYACSYVDFSGSAAPTESSPVITPTTLPASKYHVNSSYSSVMKPAAGTFQIIGFQNAGGSSYSMITTSYFEGFPGGHLAYCDDKVLIYNTQASATYNIGYYSPVLQATGMVSYPVYVPSGEVFVIQGNSSIGHQLVGRESVGGSKHGCAIDISGYRYYILSPSTPSALVYIYAYK